MNILVTGGAGFIGSHLVETLVARGDRVTVIDDFNDFYSPAAKRANLAAVRDRIELFEDDIRDEKAVRRVLRASNRDASIDAVIHLAAQAGVRPSIANPRLYVETNIGGTLNLLEAVHEFEVPRFIFASSSSVYGLNKKIPFSETDLVAQTVSPYAATKLAGEQLCSNFARLYGIETACFRFFTVYGPRQRPDLAIAKFVNKINRGEPIQRFGDGSTSRDYTYVSDIVEGIVSSLELKELDFEILNLGGSDPVTLNQLIATIERALKTEARIEPLPEQPGDLPRTFADIRRAKELLGYAPRTSLSEGIRRYVEWQIEHGS